MNVSSTLRNYGAYIWDGCDDRGKSSREITSRSGLYAKIIGESIQSSDDLSLRITDSTLRSLLKSLTLIVYLGLHYIVGFFLI